MLILLSCAKTMNATSAIEVPLRTVPLFIKEASEVALQMCQFSVEDLERLLRVNAKIAIENYKRYQSFHSQEAFDCPALLAYTGIVFKRLNPKDFTDIDFLYAQEHLRFTSFCYGLLRPLDTIHLYRLEGDVVLPDFSGQTLFSYWRIRLTDLFINEIKANGGVLVYLASDEMRGLFDWPRVLKNVKVVMPEFHLWKNGKLSTIVVYTKMARGEMARFILKNRIEAPEDLKSFVWEGFEYCEEFSDDKRFVYVLGMK
ncbi:MAG: hypothetical protein H6Q13_1959 [Bacteroidetes bacterium]|jgi:uncharacterized protein|nr:hypothetical protein [Bacteroidota bacterium]